MSLTIVPCTLAQANAFVARFHRHHAPVVGAKWCIAVADETGLVRGVAIIGRPVARHLDDGQTVEVTRLCTDGAMNACSMLYAAAWRGAQAMGYARIITYTIPSEGGASLRGAGWEMVAETPGASWSVPSRPRQDKHPLGPKWRWEKRLVREVPIIRWPETETIAQLVMEGMAA
jgi:hypothetical protein